MEKRILRILALAAVFALLAAAGCAPAEEAQTFRSGDYSCGGRADDPRRAGRKTRHRHRKRGVQRPEKAEKRHHSGDCQPDRLKSVYGLRSIRQRHRSERPSVPGDDLRRPVQQGGQAPGLLPDEIFRFRVRYSPGNQNHRR